MGKLTASVSGINTNPKCSNSVDISVTAADPSRVASVTLYYRPPGASLYLSQAMGLTLGNNLSGVWTARVTAGTGWAAGNMYYYTAGRDAFGNLTYLPSPRSLNLPYVQVYTICIT